MGPLTWTFLTGDVTRDLQAAVGWNNEGAIDISVSEVAVEGRGNVLDVMSDGGGNVVINATDGKIIDVYGHRGGGELKFDMYIDSSMTAPDSTISIKMDSGYPALGSVTLTCRRCRRMSGSPTVRQLIRSWLIEGSVRSLWAQFAISWSSSLVRLHTCSWITFA